MKQIVIYAYNEEMEALEPVATKLKMEGALVRFMSLKYREMAKCEIALTPAAHLDIVKDIFKGTDVKVSAIGEMPKAPMVAKVEATMVAKVEAPMAEEAKVAAPALEEDVKIVPTLDESGAVTMKPVNRPRPKLK